MNVVATRFKDLFILEPKVFGDSRGYFVESYNKETLLKKGIDITFVQDNQSSSAKGVLRGLHFQRAPHAQTKLVRVLSGVCTRRCRGSKEKRTDVWTAFFG